jgi:hypothetical protein
VKLVLPVLFASALASTLARAQPAASTRYATAMEQELSAMGVAARCEDEPAERIHCRYPLQPATSDRTYVMHAVYSDQTDTVYFYVERYLMLPPGGPRTETVLRRMMELNWELLACKLEWNPRTGEVRLSAILNTDSNFDRRAFRSILHALGSVAARYDAELRSLASR